jgi:selenide, water dikinase
MNQIIKLTEYSEGSGCGCKIAPAILDNILSYRLEVKENFPDLLVGNATKDDAAVFQVSEDLAFINTVDFFTPIVDDPFDFGRIAAANAVSDVYAMGGRPIFANAILSWPVEKIDPKLAAEVIMGARAVCAQINIPLAGGHSITAKDPIFGLSVNGVIHPRKIKKNNNAQEGDLIYITKPIGIGILATALKRNKISPEDYNDMIKWATQINRIGELLGTFDFVHSMTDVTGFGLLGHLIEMAEGANLTAFLKCSDLPLIPNVQTYIDQFIFPDNTYRNWNAYAPKTEGVKGMELVKLCDPQTNGGLLIAVDASNKIDFENILEQEHQEAWLIGQFDQNIDIKVKVLN